jgi:hypothetical protein
MTHTLAFVQACGSGTMDVVTPLGLRDWSTRLIDQILRWLLHFSLRFGV